MRRLLPWLALPLALGGAWWLLRVEQTPDPGDSIEPEARPPVRRPDSPQTPLAAPPPATPPSPLEEGTPDPLWPTREFRLPAGEGPVRGAELLAALEKQGGWRFSEAEAGTLDALRDAEIELAERGRPAQNAMVAAWLHQAGFLLEGEGPRFTVRRLPPDERPGADR